MGLVEVEWISSAIFGLQIRLKHIEFLHPYPFSLRFLFSFFLGGEVGNAELLFDTPIFW